MASGTYDMDVLRDILTTEEEALEELVQMYQVNIWLSLVCHWLHLSAA